MKKPNADLLSRQAALVVYGPREKLKEKLIPELLPKGKKYALMVFEVEDDSLRQVWESL